jgi:uncharacterized MAPEG superfamily protein
MREVLQTQLGATVRWAEERAFDTDDNARFVAERLGRAQANLYETLPLFIAAVLGLHALEISTPTTVLGAQLWFWGRVAYVPLYGFGVRMLRSLVWIVSFFGLVMLIAALVTA